MQRFFSNSHVWTPIPMGIPYDPWDPTSPFPCTPLPESRGCDTNRLRDRSKSRKNRPHITHSRVYRPTQRLLPFSQTQSAAARDGHNKSLLSLAPRLSTWRCPHSQLGRLQLLTDICCPRPGCGKRLMSIDGTVRRTDGRTPDRYIDPAPYTVRVMRQGWLGSRAVSVLDSGAEGPGSKSQSRRCRATGKPVHTHRASVHQAAKLVAAGWIVFK